MFFLSISKTSSYAKKILDGKNFKYWIHISLFTAVWFPERHKWWDLLMSVEWSFIATWENSPWKVGAKIHWFDCYVTRKDLPLDMSSFDMTFM